MINNNQEQKNKNNYSNKVLYNQDYLTLLKDAGDYKDDVSNYFYKMAAKYHKKYNFDNTENNPGYNNEYDAFRHTFMNAMMGLKWGDGLTTFAATLHENDFKKPANVSKETWEKQNNMDFWNNNVGRQIAKEINAEYNWRGLSDNELEDFVAEKVMEKMRNNELITSLDTDRVYKKGGVKVL